jgi:hypothetical protein
VRGFEDRSRSPDRRDRDATNRSSGSWTR